MPRSFQWDHRLYVLVDRDAPWSRVASTTRAAAATGYKKWIAVFTRPATVAAPPRSSVSAALDKLMAGAPSGDRAVEIAGLFSDAIKSCKPMVKVFGAVGGDDGGDKAKVLIEATEPALLDCHCDVDIPALRSLFFAILGTAQPQTMLTLELDRTAAPLKLPPATLWTDAVPRLTATTAWLD